MRPFRILLLSLLALSLEAAAQVAVGFTPTPAFEGQRIRARVTGTLPPAGASQPPVVRVEQGVIGIYLGRECVFLCPPSTDPVDYDLALPLLSPGIYPVHVYQGPFAIPGAVQAVGTLVVNAAADAAICVTGLWWSSPAGSESGWGLSLDHQGDVIFAVWFTYDSDGKATWFTVPGARYTTTVGTYAGPVYRNSGPPWHAPRDNAAVKGTQVGEATLAFSSETFGRFDYTIDGKSGTKYITRQVFGTPVSRCSFL
jgi:hypothetical protein